MGSAFTAAELDEQLTAWKAALLAASSGQSYTIAGRTLTRQDVKEIRDTIAWLRTEQAKLGSTRGRTGYVVPS